MKKIFTLILVSLSLVGFGQLANRTQAAFTPGNLVVYRAGDGSAALTSGATAIFLDEYTVTGTLVQSIAMPTTINGANLRLTGAGSSTSEGFLSLTLDQRYLMVTGYDAALGTATLSGTASATTNRVVGKVDADGNINTTTGLTDAYSAQNIRSVYSTNGTDIWVAGSSGGVRYTTLGSTTSTAIASPPSNSRVVKAYNGQLYVSSSTTSYYGVSAVGSGMPTTSTTATLLPGFPTASGPSSYDFSINPAGNTMYLADDRTVATGGGIQKWTLSGGTWTLAYTLNTGLSAGVRGLVVNWTTNTLYGTTGANIVSVVDAGAASAFSTVATAGTNTAFRGISFTPSRLLPLNLLSFNGSTADNRVNLDWTTTNEVNTSSFAIERSVNGKEFGSIGKVAAKGSVTSNEYNFLDEKAVAGVSYYRLKMADKDGSFKYSQVITIKNKSVGVSIYPNPVRSELTVQHEAALKGASVSILDLTGKQVQKVNVQAGAIQTSLDAAKLAPGTYLVVYNNDGVRLTKQFVKQ